MSKFLRTISVMLSFILLISMLLMGCGKTEKPAESTTVEKSTSAADATGTADTKGQAKWDTSKKDTVVVSLVPSYYTAGMKTMAEDYMKLHPETTVQIDVIADAYSTNYNTKINADKNTAPDIIQTNVAGANYTWVDKGWLMDLGKVLDEENPYAGSQKVRDVIDPNWLAYSIGNCSNKLYYLPFDLVGVGMYYNKTIFGKEGLEPPKTVEDLLNICKVLKSKGYDAPIGATFVWQWYPTMFADQAFRSMWKDLATLPGDAVWDENSMKANLDIQYSSDDMDFDSMLQMNDEKKVSYMVKNGVVNEPGKRIWATMLELCKYFQKGFISPDEQQINTSFITQKSPMMINGSWIVGKFVDDIKKLPADKQFEWGVFQLPPFADGGSMFPGKMRSLLVPGNQMGCTNKDDPDHNARTLDVLKYMYSSEVAQKIYEQTLSNGNYVQGPSLIKGVKLSDEINGYLTGFIAEGNMRWEFTDLIPFPDKVLKDDKPMSDKIFLDAIDGKITLDDFIKKIGDLNLKSIKDDYAKKGYDGDPKTKDTPKK